jgi:hypothetical protein
MIGLKAAEWDILEGALRGRLAEEWDWRSRGCECSDECPYDDKGVFECHDDMEMINRLTKLVKKLWFIQKGMENFEQLLVDHEWSG